MKGKSGREEIRVYCDRKGIVCSKCRKTIKNEPYAVKLVWTGFSCFTKERRCWRCWHTADVTQLILNKYSHLFNRQKKGAWYYLSLKADWLEFLSQSGENDPDW